MLLGLGRFNHFYTLFKFSLLVFDTVFVAFADIYFSMVNETTLQNQTVVEKRSLLRTILLVIIIIILLLGLAFSLYLVGRRVFFETGASQVGFGVPDSGNSYIFASPLKAAVGGEKIRITVFVLDGNGRGVIGKTVTLPANPALTISPVQPVTDQTGKAVFDVSASSAGLYALEASFDGETIPQRVQLRFE